MGYLTLFACGRQKTLQTEPDETFLPLTVLEGLAPVVYPYFDTHCQADDSTGETDLDGAQLSVWQNGAVNETAINLKNLGILGNPLRSEAVSMVKTGALFERTCDSTHASPPECRDRRGHPTGWTVTTIGQPLKICTKEVAPNRKTLEHVALAATVAVEKASRFFKAALPEARTIAPVEILAMPHFDTRWSPWFHNGEKGHYLTHVTENLAYFPETQLTRPFIAVFPKSANSTNEINLWESEFVLAHEFAHHLERQLGIDRFGKSSSLMRLAASEAFADSMAFASQNASDKTLQGVPCVGFDRAPNQIAFANGVAKIIDDAFMKLVETDSSQSPKVSDTNCQGVLPQSAHGIGSIFAHWIYEFAKDLPQFGVGRGVTLSRVTTKWLTQVNKVLPVDSKLSPSTELQVIARALEDTVVGQFEESNIEMTDNIKIMLCQKMSLAFPAIKDRTWFDRTDC